MPPYVRRILGHCKDNRLSGNVDVNIVQNKAGVSQSFLCHVAQGIWHKNHEETPDGM